MLHAVSLLLLASSAATAAATGITHANQSREYLLSRTLSSRPPEADHDIDCMWRKLAIRYAPQLQPWLNSEHLVYLRDALELSSLCGDSELPKLSLTRTPARAEEIGTDNITIYVDPVKGSDGNKGTIDAPLKTISAGISGCRHGRQGAETTCNVLLRAGTYHLSATVELTGQDSGLRIASYPGEKAVISGGRKLENLQWKPVQSRAGVFVASLDQAGELPKGVPALRHRGRRVTLARYPNANAELDLFPKGYITEETEWEKPVFHGETCDPNTQCGKSKNVTIKVSDAWHGMYQDYTIGVGGACERYDPPESPWCSGDFYLLRQFPEMHTRSPSGIAYAEHLPNAPYKSQEGAIVHAWRPGHWYTWMFEVGKKQTPPSTVKTWSVYENTNAIFGQVPAPKTSTDQVAYLGEFETQDRCWKACNTSTACHGWAWHTTSFDPSWAKQCYGLKSQRWAAHDDDGVVSGRGPHTEGGTYFFSAGGNQGGEGNEAAGEWWIEGAEEELDAENEYWYDPTTKNLFFYLNGTKAGDTPDVEIVIPTLATFLDLAGTKDSRVRNVKLEGLVFQDSRPTFMEPRGQPSGGDWSLERQGAVRLEGTESVTIRDCFFSRLDSNAISINGYNRHALIDQNEFVWLGQNAIASWGRANRNDGTNGEQPLYTTVTRNFCHEIGHIQKQSSFYFQAETALATITGNIVFNIPRAAINFNDGFGGGAEIAHNLFFNTCRESGDHGAFNSWDRLPYITTIRDGTPSTVPKRNNVHNNFIVANYAADGGCLDNDDGSAYYDIHHNLCMYGGHKANFDGHSKSSFNNIHVHPQVYGTKCIDEEGEGESTGTSGPHGLPPAGYAEEYTDNICILPASGDPYMVSAGSLSDKKDFNKGLVLRNNTVYVPGGADHLSVSVGGQQLSFSEFQSRGFDPTSRVIAGAPSIEQIVKWAEPLLGMETGSSSGVFII
jgi:hypothetical protein